MLKHAFISSEDKTLSITSVFQNCSSGLKLCYVFNELMLAANFFFFFLTVLWKSLSSCLLPGLMLQFLL